MVACPPWLDCLNQYPKDFRGHNPKHFKGLRTFVGLPRKLRYHENGHSPYFPVMNWASVYQSSKHVLCCVILVMGPCYVPVWPQLYVPPSDSNKKAKGGAGEGSAGRSWRKNRRGRTKQKRKRYRNHQPRNPGLLSQICHRQKHPMKHRTAQGWFHQCSIYLRSLPKRQQPGVVGFFYWDPPHIFVGLHRSSIYHLHTTYI